MKKNMLITISAILYVLSVLPTQAAPIAFGTASMEMSDPSNVPFGVIPITGAVDLEAMSLTIDPFDFLGIPWSFTSIDLYGTGNYSFNVDSQVPPGGSDPTSPGQLNMTVGDGQIGAFALFDWNVTTNIGLVLVWDVTYITPEGGLQFTAVDPDGDGILGTPMIDGPFVGHSVAVDFTTPVPVPAAAWLFLSGLLGLISFRKCVKH